MLRPRNCLEAMRTVFAIFLKAHDTRPWLVMACLIFGGIAEAAGVGTLLPVISTLSGDASANASPLSGHIQGAMTWVGVEPTLGAMIVMMCGFLVLKALLSFAALTYAGVSSATVAIGMRRRLIEALFRARWRFYADQPRGRFANAVANDATRAGIAYLHAARVMAYAAQAVAYVVVAVLVDWSLAAMGLLAGVLVTGTLGYLVRLSRRAGAKQTGRTSDLTVQTVDMIGAAKPLKTMHRWQGSLDAMAVTLRRLRRSLVKQELARQALKHGGDALIAILIGAAIYASHTVWHIPLAELVVSGIIFFQLVAIISKIQKFLQQSVEMESAYLRTEALIAEAEAGREDWAGRNAPDLAGGFSLRDVSFAHGDRTILRGLNLEIPSGAITVFMGPSGSGKTTIVDLLIGLYRADTGEIRVGETPIEAIDIDAWRGQIGYVPQELNLMRASVRANITLGDPTIDDAAIWAALDQVNARAFVEALPEGLDTGVGETGAKLSGGQRQRISFARALVADPKVLILDEVTSALDPEAEAEIVENIQALNDGRYTIIAITHRPAWTAIADRLYAVSDGQVREVVRGDAAPTTRAG